MSDVTFDFACNLFHPYRYCVIGLTCNLILLDLSFCRLLPWALFYSNFYDWTTISISDALYKSCTYKKYYCLLIITLDIPFAYCSSYIAMTVQLQNRNKATLQNVCSRPISMFYKASPLQIHTHFLKFKVCSSSSPHFKIIIYLMKRYTYICVNIDHKFEQFIHNVIDQ